MALDPAWDTMRDSEQKLSTAPLEARGHLLKLGGSRQGVQGHTPQTMQPHVLSHVPEIACPNEDTQMGSLPILFQEILVLLLLGGLGDQGPALELYLLLSMFNIMADFT